MSLQYGLISKIYGLLDILYFNNKKNSPRYGILEFIPDENLKILEVCIGTAENSIIIAENRTKAEIIGIDLSKEMLAIAKDKIAKKGIQNIKTLIMDATKMSFNSNYFDIVLISLVLHEVDDNVRIKMIKEAKRVLADLGKIIIIEWDEPQRLAQKLKFSLIKASEPKGFKIFMKLDMKKYFEKFSLKILREKKCDYTRILEITK